MDAEIIQHPLNSQTMKWINSQLQKLRQRMLKQQKQPQKAPPQKPANQYPQQVKNAKIKQAIAKQKPAVANSNMQKAKQQVDAAGIRETLKANGVTMAKKGKKMDTPSSNSSSGSYRPKSIPQKSRGKSKGKGRSL